MRHASIELSHSIKLYVCAVSRNGEQMDPSIVFKDSKELDPFSWLRSMASKIVCLLQGLQLLIC